MLIPRSLPAFTAATGMASVHYVVLLPSEQRCLDRVATRVGHGFADATATRHMRREFAGARLDPRHLIADPPDPRGTVVEILERLNARRLVHSPG